MAALAVTATGQTGETYKNYQHVSYVCKNGKNAKQKHACRNLHRYIPRGEVALRRYINDDCLEDIIEWETGGTWDPTIDYGFGHGNVYEAYGIPQAKPGYKMASAGADWRWNPITQIKWMIGYVNGRYGSSCNARAHKISRGWY